MRVALTLLLACASFAVAAQRSGGVGPPRGSSARSGPLPDLQHWIADYQSAPADTAGRMRLLSTDDARSLRDALVSHSKRGDVMKVANVSDPALIQCALAVELEAARLESADWWRTDGHEVGRYSIPTAAALMMRQRRQSDAAAHAWWRVAALLAEGAHDPYSLVPPRFGSNPPVRSDLATWGRTIFPADTWFALSEARAYQLSVGALEELASPQEGRAQRTNGKWSNRGRSGFGPQSGQLDAARSSQANLRALLDDPQYGAEARMRLGYVLWAIGELDQAREAETRVASGDGPTHTRFMAAFLLGQMELAQGHLAPARESFSAALQLYPRAQSAAFALGSLLYRDGRISEAEQLFADALPGPIGGVDPWRRFGDGDLPLLPQALTTLREFIHP